MRSSGWRDTADKVHPLSPSSSSRKLDHRSVENVLSEMSVQRAGSQNHMEKKQSARYNILKVSVLFVSRTRGGNL